MSKHLDIAIEHARRILSNLVRLRRRRTPQYDVHDLAGDCGLASMLLADAIGAPSSLRHSMLFPHHGTHVWNNVGGMIIDITATQFDDGFDDTHANDPALRKGVLVTWSPRFYHTPVCGRGMATLRMLMRDRWYQSDGPGDPPDYRQINRLYERLGAQ